MSDFRVYSDDVLSFAFYPGFGERSQRAFAYCALGLAGEAGEVAEKIKKLLRDADGDLTEEARQLLLKELGDVLFYIAAMANELGSTLGEVARLNQEKIHGRAGRGTLGGSGDSR